MELQRSPHQSTPPMGLGLRSIASRTLPLQEKDYFMKRGTHADPIVLLTLCFYSGKERISFHIICKCPHNVGSFLILCKCITLVGFIQQSEVLQGLFIPRLKGGSATGDAIALLGALIMPHNLFLHSALVLSRKVPESVHGIESACKYFFLESGFALFIAFLINVSLVAVSGSVCSSENLSKENSEHCSDLTLNNAHFLLKNVLGKSSSTIYAISLLASGQSSTITGTYAGQYIMQGFLDLKMKKWLRNFITRCIAITPSLVVSIISGSAGAGKLIIIASMILSFELPFALIPLLKFTSSETKMGPHKNSIFVVIVSWILGLLIIGINIYYLSTGFVDWLVHNKLPKVGSIFTGIIVFPLMGVYVAAVVYLTIRKDRVVTYVDRAKLDQFGNHVQSDKESQVSEAMDHEVPYREDLDDIPFPE